MKKHFILYLLFFIPVTCLIVLTGCKYDSDETMYDKHKSENPTSAAITGINPAEASAGENIITITGTNFADSLSDIIVRFSNGSDNVAAEIDSLTPTKIVIRRPNISGDDVTLSVNSFNSFLVAKQKHYKVARVLEKSIVFNDNVRLGGIDCDKSDNLYISSFTTPYSIWTITPNGDKSILIPAIPNKIAGSTITVAGDITDLRVNGDYLFLIRSNKVIQRVDINNKTISNWFNTGKTALALKSGDFDSKGYLYAGGAPKTGLWIIGQDSTSIQIEAKTYATDTINVIRVAKLGTDEYVYVSVLSKEINKIFRYKILGDKSLDSRELVIDFSVTPYASRRIKSISIAEDGTLYIGTFSAEPMLIFTTDKKLDILYKGILPSCVNQSVFDNGTNIYELSGNGTDPNWNLHKIDVGKKGAL